MSADAPLPHEMVIDGRYQLVARVTDWGVGECWRARDVEAHTRVMVKVLPTIAPSDARRAGEFASLARRLVKLEHRGVAKTLASGVVQGRPYLVQEYLDAVSLGAALSRARTAMKLLEPGMLANLIDRALEAVAAAHAQPRPMVHGGLTAGSVVAAMVDDRLVVRVLDFGLAPLFGARLRDKSAGEYTAPELDDDPERVGPASDVFALGAILTEAITDRRTASGNLAATVGGLSAISTRRDDLPSALMGVASRATRHDPDERYATVAALHEAFLAAWARPVDRSEAAPPRDDAPAVSWERYADAPTAAPAALDAFTAKADAAPTFAPLVLPTLSTPPPAPERASTPTPARASTPTPARDGFDATLIARSHPATPTAAAPAAPAFDATLVARSPLAAAPREAAPAAPTTAAVAPAQRPGGGLVALGVALVSLLAVALWWTFGR